MRKFLLSLAAASALASAATLLSSPASAMTVGTTAALQAAIEEANLVGDAAYVCRHRFYTSRRVCFWRPGRWRR